MYQDGTQQQPFVQKPGQPKFVTLESTAICTLTNKWT